MQRTEAAIVAHECAAQNTLEALDAHCARVRAAACAAFAAAEKRAENLQMEVDVDVAQARWVVSKCYSPLHVEFMCAWVDALKINPSQLGYVDAEGIDTSTWQFTIQDVYYYYAYLRIEINMSQHIPWLRPTDFKVCIGTHHCFFEAVHHENVWSLNVDVLDLTEMCYVGVIHVAGRDVHTFQLYSGTKCTLKRCVPVPEHPAMITACSIAVSSDAQYITIINKAHNNTYFMSLFNKDLLFIGAISAMGFQPMNARFTEQGTLIAFDAQHGYMLEFTLDNCIIKAYYLSKAAQQSAFETNAELQTCEWRNFYLASHAETSKWDECNGRMCVNYGTLLCGQLNRAHGANQACSTFPITFDCVEKLNGLKYSANGAFIMVSTDVMLLRFCAQTGVRISCTTRAMLPPVPPNEPVPSEFTNSGEYIVVCSMTFSNIKTRFFMYSNDRQLRMIWSFREPYTHWHPVKAVTSVQGQFHVLTSEAWFTFA